MPRRGKGKKRKISTTKRTVSTSSFESFVSAMKQFGQTAAECATQIDSTFSKRKRKVNPKNHHIMKGPSRTELPLGLAVVLGSDGYIRRARNHEPAWGLVTGRSQRIRRNKLTYYASVAQSVERPVEAREAGVQSLSGAPTFDPFKEKLRKVEKRAIHAMSYGMSPGRIEETYGGGSRARREGREEAETADSFGSEQAGIHRQPEWQREGSRPCWYDAKGTEG